MLTPGLYGLATGVHRWSCPDEDGTTREYLIRVGSEPFRGVALIFHPFGFSPESVMFGEPAGDRLIRPLDGFGDPAAAAGFIVVAPTGQGRSLAGVSLGWQPHLAAAMQVARSIAADVGTRFITAGGLSMGGLEALVLAGQHPGEVKAVWAVNPIVDLARLYDDVVARRTSPTLFEMAVHSQIAEEVGGTPLECRAEYERRSPITYAAALAHTQVRLTWSPADTIIPAQRDAHAHLLAHEIRRLNGCVDEQIVTHHPPSADLEAGRYAHEACDIGSTIGWLRSQQRTNEGVKAHAR